MGYLMLDFVGFNVKQISDIANINAGNMLNDMGFLEREINKWLKSPERIAQITADRYYDNEHDIKNKRRLVIGEGGVMTEDGNLPNNRLMDNIYSSMVDQKVNYILSKPLTINSENEEYADNLKFILNKKFHRLIKNVAKDAYNGGIGWIYPYYNERGEFSFKRFKPYEILPFWKDDDHTELDFAVRYYEVLGYQGHAEHIFKFVEVYDTQGIHRFTFENNGLKPDYAAYYFEMPDLRGELIPYNWNRVPLIPFKSNSCESSLLKRCKSLQDSINELISNFADSMQENASGNSILVIKNYDGTNLGEFRRNLSQYKAVKVSTIDGGDGGIDSISVEVNAANYQAILTELKRALIVNCRGYDINELKSSGSPNEMTIKSIYSQIDLDANELETEFQASFEELLYFIDTNLQLSGSGDYFNEDCKIIFDRDMMVNETQTIADVIASTQILSRKTCISMHPYVSDVEAEIEQIEAEQQQEIESYSGNSLWNKPEEGEYIENEETNG